MKNEILKLKSEKNAIILAHYYQRSEVQEVADFIGDSLELAKRAKETDAETIIFCGVKFMAETAKILSPNKKVYHPAAGAGCSMADMADGDMVRSLKRKHPKAQVVCYVNSTAEVKAESHICCTSSNAVDVVKSMSSDEIIFVPDRNLGAYVATQVPEKSFILWDGHCYVHGLLQASTIDKVKAAHPDAEIIAHPECTPEVLAKADFAGSTSKMLRYVKESNKKEFVVLTERGIEFVLNRDHSDKSFIFPEEALYCRTMKMTTLEDVRNALEGKMAEVTVDSTVAKGALVSLSAMFEV